jgi:ferritin-like metal-binding protein YciE
MITNLEQLYFNQIHDLCSAETQLLGILPQMAAFASSSDLRDAFQDCLRDTRTHFSQLEEIREEHGISHERISCEAMKGLVLETKRHLTKTVPGDVRDAVLIASGNRIEHYEIASYGVAKAFADCLGFDHDSELLAEMLQDVSKTDAAITKLATGGMFRSGVNQAASMV